MNETSMVSPEDQGATFVELFFDLVFVFAITQVTHYAAHHLDVHGIFRSVVVFWLIWWGWTQFTWALNSANTRHHHVRVGTLASTGVAFVMAVSLDDAFSEGTPALWFALSYVAVRVLGLGLYYKVLADDAQRTSVLAFAGLSLGGLVAVVAGGLADPSLREWFWLAAIALDFTAAWVAGNKWAWGIHAGHFAERHGLIIIIALGESLIVAGGALVSDVSVAVMVTGSLAVLLTCLLWWTYFGWVREVLEEALLAVEGRPRAQLARDAYSFGHFPLVSGIIALAVGLEASFHPEDYPLVLTAAAVGVGLSLFLGSTAVALWRARGCVLWNRLIVLALTLGALAFASTFSVNAILCAAALGLVLIVAIEQVTVRRRLATS
jgi:low temperature requirement protein LtrA